VRPSAPPSLCLSSLVASLNATKSSSPFRDDQATNSPPKPKLALGRSQSLNKHSSPSRCNPPLPLLDGLPVVPATPTAPPPSSFPHSTSLTNLINTPCHIESSSSLTRSATSVSPQTSTRPAPPVRYVSASKLTTSASIPPVPVSTPSNSLYPFCRPKQLYASRPFYSPPKNLFRSPHTSQCIHIHTRSVA
jgi:hypothetical protein